VAPDLLQTKLQPPRLRDHLVERPRLIGHLALGTTARVVLVSAPPGFGKSTLVAAWLAGLAPSVRRAWLSLDAADDDPVVFWRYVVAALRMADPDIAHDAGALLGSPDAPVHRAVDSLLNDLAALESDIVLVLDDLHVLERREIHDSLAHVIDRAPPRLHLVITTRADPPLPLARLRARGELVELRATDLRFTGDEATAYLNGAMSLELSGSAIQVLEQRTEGWIAALQLAALSMHGRDDAASFVASFAGDDRYIVDYLADEVLARQPAETRRFLLQTSILDRLTGPLCDAVTGGVDGRAMLERIERANLFLVALDDQRRWYRYHHLFADVLRIRLLDEDAGSLPALHRRAADWFEAHGERPDAIRHALAGGDADRAATLVELALPETRTGRSEGTLRRWLEALPDHVIADRPTLGAAFAGALMQTGEFARVPALLDASAAALARDVAGSDEAADVAARRRLASELAMLRAGYARITGDLPATVAHARDALELAAPDDYLPRGGAASLLGLAHWETGDLESAHASFAAGMADLQRGGLVSDVVGGQITLADIRMAQGRLSDALRAYRHGLAIATERPGPPVRGAADMHVGIADVLRERNDLAGARDHLAASHALGEDVGLPKHPARWRMAEARLRQAEGDLTAALALVDDAERVFFADFSPLIRPIPAVRARLLLALGRHDAARAWADAASVDPAAEVTYVGQYELSTLARLLLAERRADEAAELSARLVAAAEGRGWIDAALDALVARAMAAHALGDVAAAQRSLGAAFEYAEPEGAVRRFVDEGPPMAAVLAVTRRSGDSGFGALLAAAMHTAGPIRREALAEPLSQRELEVLRLLATELSGPEIADHLVVSLNTVRSHTKAIYAKLGVTSRRAAVRRASELDLLTGRL
jgi:LuxR family maltose regulon positive regulatory protein